MTQGQQKKYTRKWLKTIESEGTALILSSTEHIGIDKPDWTAVLPPLRQFLIMSDNLTVNKRDESTNYVEL
jgi:hypothetical protein